MARNPNHVPTLPSPMTHPHRLIFFSVFDRLKESKVSTSGKDFQNKKREKSQLTTESRIYLDSRSRFLGVDEFIRRST